MKVGVQVYSEMLWNNCVICPRCQSNNVKKDGHYRSYQKYFCKQCERGFNDKTGTVFHYSHTLDLLRN